METLRVYEIKITDGITHKEKRIKVISDGFKNALEVAYRTYREEGSFKNALETAYETYKEGDDK